jgi:2-amino-1-hydroxyethylphosphonate dioxygenase (glycine-forming)
MRSIESIVDEIISLYELHGSEDYIGEPVSQLEHMSQSAQLAMEQGADDEVILAAFFHDIGHFSNPVNDSDKMAGYGTQRHELIGANFLRERGFPERIAQLIENHVQAKRYLTYSNKDYYESLSEASKKTLEFQGGVMTAEEADAFEQHPLFNDSIRLRKWDEAAKIRHRPIIDLSIIRQKAINSLTLHRNQSK